MPPQPDKVKSVFLAAIESGSPEGWSAYLDGVCGDNGEMRARVEQLLRAHADLGALHDKAGDLSNIEDYTGLAEKPGTMAGPYKLLEKIGEGGFGIVYMAQQQRPVQRKVALKIIKLGMDTRAVVARFEAEQQALALMDHPNIARVFDGGATESGRPYFVMELVRGVPITDYCDQNQLSVHARLQLFIEVCRAVQHAHQKGVIHRDLKPSNVMITLHDGQPVPKVIDFGIAKAINQKLTEKTLFTNFCDMIGTPLYMSPEQAELSGLDVDTRTDVYSLGVLLYELLCGTTPFDSGRLKQATYDELRNIVRVEDPPKPSDRLSTLGEAVTTASANRQSDPQKLSVLIRGELDWIVMRALEKQRDRRYATVGDLAADIERFLINEPVEAGPPSAGYHLKKFARRNRVFLTTASVIGAVLLLGSVVSAWQAVRATWAEGIANEQRQIADKASQIAEVQKSLAERQRDLTLENLYVAHVRLAHQDWKAGHLNRMIETLDAHLPKNDLPDMRGWEWYYLASLSHKYKDVVDPQLGSIRQVEWDPDGRLVAIAGDSGVQIYEPISQQVVQAWPGYFDAKWSPDGSRLAIVGQVGNERVIRIVSTENWEELHTIKRNESISCFVWRADGHALAWEAGPNEFNIWEQGEKEPASFRYPTSKLLRIASMAWGPEGRLLVMGGAFPPRLVIWDSLEKKPVRELDIQEDARGITHIAWSPERQRLATGSINGDLALWDVVQGEGILNFGAHNGEIFQCDWSSEGKRLVSSGEDNLVRIWDAKTGRQVRRFPGHRSLVRSVDWSPQGDWIVSGSSDGSVRFWRPPESQDALLIPGRETVAWSPDGKRIVTNDPRHEKGITYSIRDSRSGQIVKPLESKLNNSMHVFAWSPNGKMIAGACFDGTAHVWDVDTGQSMYSLSAHRPQEARCVAWSPDNRQFASCGSDRLVKIWEASSGKLLHEFKEHGKLASVCWSPDGRWFASADWKRHVKIRSTDSWQTEWEINADPASVGRGGAGGTYTIAWSRDSQQLASVNASGQIAVWNLLEENEVQQAWCVEAHTSTIRSIAWSPDRKRIATGSEDRSAKIWDAATGRELLTLEGYNNMVTAVVWSPDGRRLASTDSVSMRIWDATDAYENPASTMSKQDLE